MGASQGRRRNADALTFCYLLKLVETRRRPADLKGGLLGRRSALAGQQGNCVLRVDGESPAPVVQQQVDTSETVVGEQPLSELSGSLCEERRSRKHHSQLPALSYQVAVSLAEELVQVSVANSLKLISPCLRKELTDSGQPRLLGLKLFPPGWILLVKLGDALSPVAQIRHSP